jgi:ABC-type transport system involved in multi-copper enzyme maturation permease subunit
MMTLLYLLFLPLQLLAAKSMQVSIPGVTSSMMVEFPTVWTFLAYGGSWLAYFFWGFLAIYIFSSEFSQRTFRQNIISGLTREELYFGKIGFIFSIAITASLYFVLCALLFGWVYTPEEKEMSIFTRSITSFRYLLMCLGYMSLGVFIVILIRKTAASVFIYFAYSIFMEPMLRWFIHKPIIDNRSMHFYPANAFEDLTPLPLSDLSITKDLVKSGDLAIYLSPTEATITSLIYILIFIAGAYWMVRKKDL